MAYQHQEEQSCFLTGFIKESKTTPGTHFVTTSVVSLKEIAELCGSDLVELAVYDSKKEPLKQKSIKFKKGDPKYFRSLKDFNRGSQQSAPTQTGSGPSASTYGTAQRQDDFIP